MKLIIADNSDIKVTIEGNAKELADSPNQKDERTKRGN